MGFFASLLIRRLHEISCVVINVYFSNRTVLVIEKKPKQTSVWLSFIKIMELDVILNLFPLTPLM